MVKTVESTCVSVGDGSKSIRTHVPALVRDLLDLSVGDKLQYNIHFCDDNKFYITLTKKK